ncbi:hypothetical protein TNCV_3543041 [Trichonephila clavipes]|nr:hypothetical protein TNCV_3543041 [Trichonephila clavipes]
MKARLDEVQLTLMDRSQLCPGKGLGFPTCNIDNIVAHVRFLLISLTNSEMSKKSPFAASKVLVGIVGGPKSIKRLRYGGLLIETV